VRGRRSSGDVEPLLASRRGVRKEVAEPEVGAAGPSRLCRPPNAIVMSREWTSRGRPRPASSLRPGWTGSGAMWSVAMSPVASRAACSWPGRHVRSRPSAEVKEPERAPLSKAVVARDARADRPHQETGPASRVGARLRHAEGSRPTPPSPHPIARGYHPRRRRPPPYLNSTSLRRAPHDPSARAHGRSPRNDLSPSRINHRRPSSARPSPDGGSSPPKPPRPRGRRRG
jgi:hypothetical protein